MQEIADWISDDNCKVRVWDDAFWVIDMDTKHDVELSFTDVKRMMQCVEQREGDERSES